MIVISLRSKNKDIFKVDKEALKFSILLTSILDDVGNDILIPLPGISTRMLKRCIYFMNYYKDKPFPELPKPLSADDIAKLTNKAYKNFVDLSMRELYDLIMAACYLDIKPLVQLVAAQMALMMRSKQTMDDARDLFNLKNDFTHEEELEAQQSVDWVNTLKP